MPTDRKDVNIIRKCFNAPKAKTFVANSLANLFITRPDVTNCLEVGVRKRTSLVRDEQLAAVRSIDYKADRNLSFILGRVSVVRILEQLEKNTVAVLCSYDVVEALRLS
ncbi:hypothetical protein PMN64_11280 [Bradyrhizobium sp. UFLA01-814]